MMYLGNFPGGLGRFLALARSSSTSKIIQSKNNSNHVLRNETVAGSRTTTNWCAGPQTSKRIERPEYTSPAKSRRTIHLTRHRYDAHPWRSKMQSSAPGKCTGVALTRGVDSCLNEETHSIACHLSPDVDDGAQGGIITLACDIFFASHRVVERHHQLAAGMLGDLFSPGDFGTSDGGGPKDEGGGKPGISLPEFRPTGELPSSP